MFRSLIFLALFTLTAAANAALFISGSQNQGVVFSGNTCMVSGDLAAKLDSYALLPSGLTRSDFNQVDIEFNGSTWTFTFSLNDARGSVSEVNVFTYPTCDYAASQSNVQILAQLQSLNDIATAIKPFFTSDGLQKILSIFVLCIALLMGINAGWSGGGRRGL